MSSAFYSSGSAAYVQVHYKLDFSMEANTMNSDPTTPFVCNICYLRTSQEHKQTGGADDKSRDWRAKG